MSKPFYWIALQTPNGGLDVRGPYNTEQGRDKEYVQNKDFWTSAGVISVPFDTIGRKKAEAYSLAKQVLEQTAAPQSDTPNIITQTRAAIPAERVERISQVQPIEISEVPQTSQIPQEIGQTEAIESGEEESQFSESFVDVAGDFREENVGADIGPEELEFGGEGDSIFSENIDDAINSELDFADNYEREAFSAI